MTPSLPNEVVVARFAFPFCFVEPFALEPTVPNSDLRRTFGAKRGFMAWPIVTTTGVVDDAAFRTDEKRHRSSSFWPEVVNGIIPSVELERVVGLEPT